MRWILIALMISALAGCGSNRSPDAEERTAEAIYEEARAALDRGSYIDAIEAYETLQSEYPFGEYATQAQLDLIFAYKKRGETESAVAAADRFIRLNPRHEKVPYAIYMRGVARQDSGKTTIRRFLSDTFNLKRARRDPEPLEKAFGDFRRLIQRHPESQYVDDARERMTELRDLLAEHDLAVARFYAEREAWVAVARRTKRILQRYPETSAIPDALKLMRQAYGAMDLTPLREDIEDVLRANGVNPDSARS